MEDSYWVFFAVGVLIGLLILALTLGAFGVFDAPQVKLCDDLAILLNMDTQVTRSDCQIKVGEYFVDYSQWIELQ